MRVRVDKSDVLAMGRAKEWRKNPYQMLRKKLFARPLRRRCAPATPLTPSYAARNPSAVLARRRLGIASNPSNEHISELGV